jgi:type 1 fimbria pilin
MKTSLLALVLLGTAAQAADTVNITVRGTLTRPPCVLSTATTLTAEFANVRTDQVATTGTVTVPVLMTCPAGSSLNVSFTASDGTHTATVAKTTADNLGVSLLWADNTAANLNGTAKTYSNLSGVVNISLRAQLIARGALTPGAFTSSMVMTITYL